MLHLVYNDNYPLSPPFIRVVYPYLEGNSMTFGGVICSQLLTENGWSSSYTIEPLVLRLSATLTEGEADFDPKYGQLQHSYAEAKRVFEVQSKITKREHWSLPDKS
uniref:Ubiquitin-conjugating enzyme E2 Q1 n=1 Tax=Aceria tosichella TaxID=561515 RepID=A0A6G1SIL5_9ACAR